MESLFNNFPYYQMINSYNKDADFVWQNSPIRAFLNSSSTNELDGDKLLTADLQYDFTQTGFLNQALNMTRQASRVYTIPQTETEICNYAFDGCVGLERIIIPSNVKLIGEGAFNDIKNSQIIFRDHEEEVFLSPMTFRYIGMEYIYLSKTNSDVILSPYLDQSLEKDCLRLDFKNNEFSWMKFLNKNYRQNFLKLTQLKEEGKIGFMPPRFTLNTFPSSQIENYVVNKNYKRWGNFIKQLGIDKLPAGDEKTLTLTDLMKIYYAVGGFSKNQGESEKAYEYLLNCFKSRLETLATKEGYHGDGLPYFLDEVHEDFNGLVLNGEYNKTFAKFFMRY